MHRNAAAAVRSIYYGKPGGVLAFVEFRAVIAQMLRDIPYAVVMLVVYEGKTCGQRSNATEWRVVSR